MICACKIAKKPCSEYCTCANPIHSGGCACCATYGSFDQQKKAAEYIKSTLCSEQDSKLPPNEGRVQQAKRFALRRFEEWNEVTGFPEPHSTYYYEICSLIEEAAEFGFGVAHGQNYKEILKRIEGEL